MLFVTSRSRSPSLLLPNASHRTICHRRIRPAAGRSFRLRRLHRTLELAGACIMMTALVAVFLFV